MEEGTPGHFAERVRDALSRVDIRNPSRPGDRHASVLLGLIDEPSEPTLLGVVRTTVGVHGGQFALPGGVVEVDDDDPWRAAVREAREEVGLDGEPESLGRLGEFNTHVSRFRVDVHVARVTPQVWRPQPEEIAAVVEIPIARLDALHRGLPHVDDVWRLPLDSGYDLDLAPYLVAGALPPPDEVSHTVEIGDGRVEVPRIWGLTARVLYEFIRCVWAPGEDGN